jgi:hypothetical protein
LTSDPTEHVRLWAGRLLLTRLDDGGTRFLAGSEAMNQVIEDASTVQSDSASGVHAVQGALVGALLCKVASLSSSDEKIMCEYFGAVMQILRSGKDLVNTLQVVRTLECVCNSCHSVFCVLKCKSTRTSITCGRWSKLIKKVT